MEIQRQYVSIAEAIKITGLSYNTIYRRVSDGTLSRIKYSRKVMIPIDELVPQGACERKAEE